MLAAKKNTTHRLLKTISFCMISGALAGGIGASPLFAQTVPEENEKKTSTPADVRTWDEDWSDLTENEYDIFGSEKEAKFPINAFFIEKEDWKDHYSLKLFWLFKRTRYPKFESTRFFPFYYHLWSKNDNREKYALFPFYYSKVDGSDYTTLTPLSYRSFSPAEDVKLYGYFYYSSQRQNGFSRALLPFIFWGEDKRDNSSYSSLFPFFYKSEFERGQESGSRLLTPIFYHSQNNGLGSGRIASYETFSISPLHYYSAVTGDDPDTEDITLWAPVLPLFYRHREKGSVHYNLLGIFDTAFNDTTGLERFWISPLLYYKRGVGGYFHVLPPIYLDFQDSKGYGYNHFLPFYINYEDENEQSSTWITPLFYSHADPQGEHKNFLLLFDWQNDEKDNLTRFWFTPFYFSGEGYRHIFPFYLSFTSQDETGLEDEFTAFGPVYYYNTTKEEISWLIGPLWRSRHLDRDESSLHILPLWFSYQEGSETTNVFPLFLSYRNNNPETEQSLTVIPPLLYFDKTDKKDYSRLYGPYYTSRNDASNTESNHILPLWFHFQEGAVSTHILPFFLSYHRSNPELKKSFTFIPLLYYNDESGDDYSRFYGPVYSSVETSEQAKSLHVIPLYFSWEDESGTHKNIIGLFDWEKNEKNELLNFWAMPFFFYGRDTNDPEEYYWHILPPVWMSFHTGETDLYIGLPIIPVFHASDENESSTFAGLFWRYNNEKEESSSYHAFPLIYTWFEKDEYSVTVLPLISWGNESHSSGYDFYSLTPLWYYTDTEDRERNTSETWFISPLLYYDSEMSRPSEKSRLIRTTIINPLFYHHNNISKENLDIEFYNTLAIPLLPVLYYSHSETDEGTLRNALILANWRTNKEGDLERLWISPFYYHKKDDYLHVTLFYHRPGPAEAKEGFSAGLFHYHGWSPEHDLMVSLPYYSWDYEEGSRGSIFIPAWIKYESRNEEGVQKSVNIYFGGISSSKAAGDLDFGTGKTGKWFFDTEYSFMYNLFSVAGRVSIPNPFAGDKETNDESKKDEKKEEKSIIAKNDKTGIDDTNKTGIEDVKKGGLDGPSLEYFGKNEQEIERKREEQKKEMERSDLPRFTRKNDVEREDSEYYFRTTLLYGLFSYQWADTKRHFRFFPFAWFTWDTRSDDGVQTIPFVYLNYNSDETSFYVIGPVIPLYGHQRQGKSYIKSYGAFLYLREYDDETKQDEYSVLWPLVNWYDSPTRDGFRILPLLTWHKNTHTQEEESTRTISPVYYKSYFKYKYKDGRVEEEGKTINPVWFSSTSGSANYSNYLGLTLLPVFGYADSTQKNEYTDHSDTRSQPLTNETGGETKKSDENTRQKLVRTRGGNWWYLFPFVYRSTENTEIKDKQERIVKSSEESLLVGLPLLYAASYTERNQTPAPENEGNNKGKNEGDESVEADQGVGTETYHSTFFLMGYYSYEDEAEESSSFLGGLYGTHEEKKTGKGYTSLLYGLTNSHYSPEESSWKVLPVVYRYKQNRKDFTESVWLFPALLTYYSHEESFKTPEPGDKKAPDARQSKKSETVIFSPLFYYEWWGDTQANEYDSTLSIPFLLYYSDESRGANQIAKNTHFLFPLFFNDRDEFDNHWNVALLFDVNFDRKTDTLERFWFIPLVFYAPGEDGYVWSGPFYYGENSYNKQTTLHLFPLYLSWVTPEESTRLIFGLYTHSSEKYSRQNFFYLFDHQNDLEARESTWNFLLASVHFHSDPYENTFRLFYGLLAGFEYNLTEGKSYSDDYDFNLLWLRNFRESETKHFSFIPLWWYESNPVGKTESEWTLVLPPLLTYINSSTDYRGGSSYFLLGTYFYNSEQYSRQNFFYLYDHYREGEIDTYDFALKTIHFEFSPKETEFALFFRLGGGFEYRNSDNYNANFLWFYAAEDGPRTNLFLLPFFYYNSDGESTTWAVPPALAYGSRDDGGVLELWGLGAAYYRNYDAYTRVYRRNVGLGIIFSEVARPERQYHSVGSVWGILWEYQTEKETGFKKFSILKLPFYKRVNVDGEMRTSVLGVTIE